MWSDKDGRPGHRLATRRHRCEIAAIGTVANVASRLCGEAISGQIVISQGVLNAVVDIVEAEPFGELAV